MATRNTNIESKPRCACGDACTCENCTCGDRCACSDRCNCGDQCTCGSACNAMKPTLKQHPTSPFGLVMTCGFTATTIGYAGAAWSVGHAALSAL